MDCMQVYLTLAGFKMAQVEAVCSLLCKIEIGQGREACLT